MGKRFRASVVSAGILFLGAVEPAYGEFAEQDAVAFVRLQSKMIAPKLYEEYREAPETDFVQWKTKEGREYFFVGFYRKGAVAAFDALIQNCASDGGGLMQISMGERLLEDMLAEHRSILTDPADYEDVCFRTD